MIEYNRQEPPDEQEYFSCCLCFDEFHINDLEIFDSKRDQYICNSCAHEIDNDPMWRNETKKKPLREIECLKCGKAACVCRWQKNVEFAARKINHFAKRAATANIQKMTITLELMFVMVAANVCGLTSVPPDWLRTRACRGAIIQMIHFKLVRFAKRQPVNINVRWLKYEHY